MKPNFENYFLGISDEDIKLHKLQVREVRKRTGIMIRDERNRLIKKGWYR